GRLASRESKSTPEACESKCRKVDPSGPAGWSSSTASSSTASITPRATTGLVTDLMSYSRAVSPKASTRWVRLRHRQHCLLAIVKSCLVRSCPKSYLGKHLTFRVEDPQQVNATLMTQELPLVRLQGLYRWHIISMGEKFRDERLSTPLARLPAPQLRPCLPPAISPLLWPIGHSRSWPRRLLPTVWHRAIPSPTRWCCGRALPH